jgi:hypothetical protein
MDPPSEPLADSVRLYLSPFTPALLPTYLPGDFQQRASDISYHTIETFPDRPYGYVTVPAMDATKIKNKLSGAILKGSKVRIEEARPAKRKAEELGVEETAEDIAAAKKKAKKEKKKKSKSQEGVYAGIELEEGRSVKRGWTEPSEYKSKKDKKAENKGTEDKKAKKPEKSKYTKEPELLFKTKLPPNKVANEVTGESKDKKKKKSKKTSRETVVHEFEKTQKHASFLKNPAADSKHGATTEFVDGKGWVDQQGTVIEKAKPVREKKMKKSERASKIPVIEEPPASSPAGRTKKAPKSPSPSSSEISSSSDSSSDSSDSSSDELEQDEPINSPLPENGATVETESGTKKKPHPLETLFKRTPGGKEEKRPTPIDTSFSFFGGADQNDSEAGDELPEPPQTPFTQHVEARYVSRSGAPTPDTAAVHRRFSFNRGVVDPDPDNGQHGDDDEDEEEDNEVAKDTNMLSPVEEGYDGDEGATINGALDEKAAGDQDESQFAKWFWEKRGDNNRTWKRRRKEALKEKRQRDTRRLGRRML